MVDRAAGVICDAKSGVSGAGRKPSLTTSFCEVTENFAAYSVLNHRHVPEVLMISGLEEREFSFTAQLLPIARGILETIYVRLLNGAGAERLLEIYEQRYTAEPFIRLYQAGLSRTCTPSHTPISATSELRSMPPAAAPWWSAPSITWSKERRGRPCKI